MGKLVYGVGINDADYPVQPVINGKQVKCQFYVRWHNMLERCYSNSKSRRRASYSDCTVCEEWLTFSNFKSWMEMQDWEGKFLDKDLLSPGNKVYSPKFCVFISRMVNNFIVCCKPADKKSKTGVHLSKRDGVFQAKCRNPFTGKCEHLGDFGCETSAHSAWGRRKLELGERLASLQTDNRVSEALLSRYAGFRAPDSPSSDHT